MSDLAALLASVLQRGTEAKKTLANLFAARGRVSVSSRAITVTLRPAASEREAKTFQAFFRQLSLLNLTTPGDRKERPLVFR